MKKLLGLIVIALFLLLCLTIGCNSTPSKSVESIEISSYPEKTSYIVGEAVDTTGLVLNVKYSDGTTGTVTTGFTVSPKTITSEGLQTITITYGGKTTTYTVKCSDKKPNVFMKEDKNDECLKLESCLKGLNSEKMETIYPANFKSEVQKRYMNFSEYYKDGFTTEEARKIQILKERKQSFSKSDAIEDVEVLFRVFRYNMGRYVLLGGDPTFTEAKQKVLDKLSKCSDSDPITMSQLQDYLVEALAFVDDCHFSINDYNFLLENGDSWVNKTFFSGIILEKDESGYFRQGNPNSRYVSCDCEDAAVSNYLDADGKMLYTLTLYCPPDDKPDSSVAVFSDLSEDIQWTYEKKTTQAKGDCYLESGNIAYLSMANLSPSPIVDYEQHVTEYAKKAKNKDIVIVDLRGSGGIHNTFADVFSEEKAVEPMAAFYRATTISQWNVKKGREQTYFSQFNNQGKTAFAKNLVIVLVDSGTDCASEDFAEGLKYYDYAFLVGTSTKGALDGGCYAGGGPEGYDLQFCSLPKTGLGFRCANGVHLYENYDDRCGRGFKPDFYVEDTTKALGITLNYLVNCGLTTKDAADIVLRESGE